jgi:hypothetical protein
VSGRGICGASPPGACCASSPGACGASPPGISLLIAGGSASTVIAPTVPITNDVLTSMIAAFFAFMILSSIFTYSDLLFLKAFFFYQGTSDLCLEWYLAKIESSLKGM